MKMSERIPVTVVTGFLGAGKTTLIRHLLENAGGRRIALVVNEFGDLGFDGSLIAGCVDPACADDDVVELTNGCLCCTVADDFLPAMEKLIDRPEPPDHIVIETSGLALPQPLLTAFGWPTVKPRVTVDGVVAVVDARAVASGLFAPDPDLVDAQRRADEALDHESPLEELFEDQLRAADLVVLTKCDLIGAEEDATVRAAVETETRANVPVVVAEHGRIAPSVVIGLGADAEDDAAARAGHHGPGEEHDHDDFDSLVLSPPPFASVEAARAAAEELLAVPGVLRVKGRLGIGGRPAPLVVQGVGPRIETWFDRPGVAAGGLVVIGLKPLEPAVRIALDAVARAA